MKKNIIKIGVPFLVLVGIITLIISTQKPIEELSSDLRIEPFNFNSYVEKYITDSINGKTLDEARQKYNNIYDIISTEASVELKNSSQHSRLLEAQEAEELFSNAFKAYFMIFGNDADHVFVGQSWNESDLNKIKMESQRLLSQKGIQLGKDSLNNYISYVNGYYAATKLIRNSQYCSGVNSYNDYCARTTAYQKYPYINNSRLKNISTEVSSNAREGWRSTIERYVNDICNHPNTYYSSYDDFYNGDLTSAYDRIKEYNNTTNSSWGKDLKSKLNSRDSELKTYFENREKSNGYNL